MGLKSTATMTANSNNPAQIYKPPKPINPAEDSSKQLVKQCFGYTLGVLMFIVVIGKASGQFSFVGRADNAPNDNIYYGAYGVGDFITWIFFFNLLHYPDYAAGNPSYIIFWPLYLGLIVKAAAYAYLYFNNLNIYGIGIKLGIEFVVTLVLILVYGANDESKSCCLCFKPWVYKTKMVPYNAAYPPQGYQAPGAYPPQAYQANNAYPPQV
jgi:hypothetical protein